jgi:hypothetical protein
MRAQNAQATQAEIAHAKGEAARARSAIVRSGTRGRASMSLTTSRRAEELRPAARIHSTDGRPTNWQRCPGAGMSHTRWRARRGAVRLSLGAGWVSLSRSPRMACSGSPSEPLERRLTGHPSIFVWFTVGGPTFGWGEHLRRVSPSTGPTSPASPASPGQAFPAEVPAVVPADALIPPRAPAVGDDGDGGDARRTHPAPPGPVRVRVSSHGPLFEPSG